MEDFATKLQTGDAVAEVKDGQVTVTETVKRTFDKEEIIGSIADLNNKHEELKKAIDQTKANIVDLEKQLAIVESSRENFRELLKQVE